jgi:aminoglycoside 6-adenylyltransferase
MNIFPQSYAELEAAVLAWAIQTPDLELALVVGSRARSQALADEWSDLDLILFFEDPRPWTSEHAWLEAFGEVELIYSDPTRAGDVEWLLLYASGLKADFMVARFPPQVKDAAGREQYLLGGPFAEVFAFGVRVLVDKRAEFADLPGKVGKAGGAALPNERGYSASLQRFWMDCTRAAKFLRRGDVWRAKMLCDCTMKQEMLTMLEWLALAGGASSGQVWYEGRNLPDWAEARALEALPDTFGRYEGADLWHALEASMRLYNRLAQECGLRLGYDYPEGMEGRIVERVRSIRGTNQNHAPDW